MTDLKRVSPVEFDAEPVATAVQDHWTVVRRYAGEGQGPWLADLSHKSRWDFQDAAPEDNRTNGFSVPPTPGGCRLENKILTSRLNPTQAAIWHLGDEAAPALPPASGFTDVSEAAVCLALFGPRVFAVTEKLTALDLTAPDFPPPFLLQGPFCRIACKVAVLGRESDGGGILVAGARGYARDLVRAVMAAGKEWGLRPAGEERFGVWLASVAAG